MIEVDYDTEEGKVGWRTIKPQTGGGIGRIEGGKRSDGQKIGGKQFCKPGK